MFLPRFKIIYQLKKEKVIFKIRKTNSLNRKLFNIQDDTKMRDRENCSIKKEKLSEIGRIK